MNLAQLAVTPRYEVVGYGNVVAVAWRQKGEFNDMQQVYEIEREQRTAAGRALASIVVVHTAAVARISGEQRKNFEDIENLKEDGFYKAQVLALITEGFSAAIIRGIVAAGMLIPKGYPRKVTSTVDEALLWLRPHIVPAVSEEDLAPLRMKLAQT